MKKVAIVIGHDNNKKGAALAGELSFIQEYEYNTILAGLVKMYSWDIANLDVKIFLRDGLGIRKTYDLVEKWEADASIELHYNSFTGKAEGSMVLYGSIPKAGMLAGLLRGNIRDVMENRDRGTKYVGMSDRGGVNLNGGKVPRVLIEPFFGSDLDDTKRGLMQMHELAKCLLKSAVQFLFS